MAHQRLAATSTERDDRDSRPDLWAALTEYTHRERDSVTREQVLRQLLDDAHQRIRTLEATLARLTDRETSAGDPRRADDDWVE